MTESSKTLDGLLTLPPADAIDRLMEMSDLAEPLHGLLQRVIEGRYAAGQGILVVASALAKSDVRAALSGSLSELVQVVLTHPDARRDPAVADPLRSALGEIEDRIEANNSHMEDAQRSELIAMLSRARAMMALDAGEADEAQTLLLEALEHYQQLEFHPGIAAIAIDLSGLQWDFKNTHACVEYLIQAADHIPPQPSTLHEQFREAIVGELVRRAAALYYDANDAPSAIRLARRAAELAPNEAASWQIFANALLREQKFESAIEAYEHLAALDPQELSSARANLAVALVQVNRLDDALAAVNESLRLRPGQVRPLLLRGQLRERANGIDGAIEDLEATISLLEADRPVDNEQDPATTKVYREHWTMWLAAYNRLVAIHQQRNDLGALKAIIERLKATGDDALTAMGHRLSGDLARAAGGIDEAAHEYDLAIAAFAGDAEARKARAELAAEARDVDSAIDHFARMTSRDADPKAAIEGLTSVAKRFPDDRRVQRWLGFAYFEIGEFETAEANLDAYLAGTPDDVEARRWLGLSLISANSEKRQPRKDGQRCFRGLDELARATSQGDAESKRSLLWVIDRLLLKFGFVNFYLASARTVLDALPRLDDFIKRLEPALMGGRDYEKRIAAFSEAIPMAQALQLPCYVAFLHFMLGDIELLLGHTQSARDHLREAQKLQSIVFGPRSANLQPQHEAVVQEYFMNTTMEVEHLHIYDKVTEALTQIQNLSARIDAASGVQDDAEGGMQDVQEIASYAETIPALEAMPIVQTLRDSGRLDDALLVLERVEKKHGKSLSKEERGSLLVTRSTVLAARGDLPEAVRAIQVAEPLLDVNRRWVAWMNIASYAEASGLYAEALQILEEIDIDRVARSGRDCFSYHYLRGVVLEGCERPNEAFEAAATAIATLETLRFGLKDVDLRSSWAGQKQTTGAYALAVRLAVRLGRLRSAFDLVESSRSRLLIDEMAMGRGVLDEAGRRLAVQVQDLEEKRDILQTMVGGDDRQALRPDALVRLKHLDPKLQLVRLDEKGFEYIDAKDLAQAQVRTTHLLERFEQKVVRHRFQSAKQLFGDVVGYDASKALLGGLGHAALVELVVQDKETLAFLLRPGADEPIVVHALEDIDVGSWALELVKRLANIGTTADQLGQSPLANLLGLIENETDEGDVLCFVPHGALHLVPFHALQLSAGYLIDRNPVAYAPSASVLARTIHGPEKQKYSGAIVVGDTRGDLPYADREARDVGRLLKVDPLQPREATRRRLRDTLAATNHLRILHLACHGYFDVEDAMSSGILATDDDEQGHAAVLSARDLLRMEFHSDLITMSACESGMSDVTPGDELMGLNRALLVAGTRSVLSSSWRVNDLSTSLLMRFFYEGWIKDGLSKAHALRAAQRRLMKLTRWELEGAFDGDAITAVRDLGAGSMRRAAKAKPSDRVFARPAHWAAFSLVGDWR